MLVALAACLFVLTGLEIAQLDFGGGDALRVDPLRLIEAVTAGVAFLAAGPDLQVGRHGAQRHHRRLAVARRGDRPRLRRGARAAGRDAAVLVVIVLYLLGRIERATGTHHEPD